MATIGNLKIMLTAGAGAFIKTMGFASHAVKQLGSTTMAALSPMNALKVVMGGLALGGLTALATRAVRASASLARSARIMGFTASSVATLQYAVRGLGGDSASVSHGLEHFNQVLSGVGDKSRFASMLLSKYGLTLHDLDTGDLGGVKKIADAIAATSDPLRRATLAQALFNDGAADMLPILAQGSAGIDAFADRAKAMGQTFTGIQGLKLEALNGELNKAEDLVSGMSRRSAVELGEAFYDAVGSVEKIADAIGRVDTLVRKIFRTFQIGWNLAKLGGMGFLAWFDIGSKQLFEKFARKLAKLLRVASHLPVPGSGALLKVADAIDAGADRAKKRIAGWKSEWFNAMDAVVRDIDRGYGEIRDSAAKTAHTLDFGKKLNAGGAVNALDRFKEAIKGFAHIFQETQTPMERFQNKLAELNTFLKGTGDIEHYARGVAGLVNELEKAHSLSEIRLAGATQRGSVAAASAINQSEALNNRRLREKPEDRIARIMQQSQEIERQQLEYMKRIAEAQRAYQPVRIV